MAKGGRKLVFNRRRLHTVFLDGRPLIFDAEDRERLPQEVLDRLDRRPPKRKVSPQSDRARWAILQLYPKGVPDQHTVSPKILHSQVAEKLLERETAKLKLPAPSQRVVELVRDSLRDSS